MTDEKQTEDKTRIIVLVYGLLESGNPFWMFAAVYPGKYQAFLTAQKDHSLDVHQFKSYGEIIISGEGKAPPDDIILKIAEMYQTTPDVLMKAAEDKNS